MDLTKQLRMIELLLGHSRLGSIDWKPTANQNTIEVTFNRASLLLSQLPSREVPDEYDYRIQIIGPTGDVVEAFRDADFEGDVQKVYRMLHELFELGRRKALGTDAALDSIIEELNNIIPF
jgi:hypothetical protein